MTCMSYTLEGFSFVHCKFAMIYAKENRCCLKFVEISNQDNNKKCNLYAFFRPTWVDTLKDNQTGLLYHKVSLKGHL